MVNVPAITILFVPGSWTIPKTVLFGPVPTLSRVVSYDPLSFNLTTYGLEEPLYVVNNPEAKILPSGLILRELTLLLNPTPVLNVESKVPLIFTRTKRLAVEPLYKVKFPPTTILLSDWSRAAIPVVATPVNPVPIFSVVSIVPLILRRTIPDEREPLYVVKPPTTIIFPSGWIKILFTAPLNPTPDTNEVSWVPLEFKRII